MRQSMSLTVLIFALVAMGCTPDSLEGFEPDTNNANNVNNANNTNNTNNTAGGTFTAEFVAVSGILAQECGAPACHGSAAANAFALPTDQNATPSEMQAGLQGNGASGMPLIAPGNAAGSDVWDRMTRMTSDPQYMPLGGIVLDQTQYTAIETWINNGAVYTE